MATTPRIQCKIVKNGGPITKDVYKAYYSAGTAASEDWSMGEIVSLDATGYIRRGDLTLTHGAAGTTAAISSNVTNDDWSAAVRRFIALEDHDSSAEGKSVYVAVQEIMEDTILEFQLAASGSTAPTQAKCTIGATYAVYMYSVVDSAVSDYYHNTWGLDVDDSTYGFLQVVEKDSDTKWMVTESGVAGTANSGLTVRVKITKTLLA